MTGRSLVNLNIRRLYDYISPLKDIYYLHSENLADVVVNYAHIIPVFRLVNEVGRVQRYHEYYIGHLLSPRMGS